MRSFCIAATVALAAANLTLVVAETASAQTNNNKEIERVELTDLLDFETVGNPQISPDSKTILYIRGRVDAMKDRRTSSI